MKYKIISGMYETGNAEQQAGYEQLFGKDEIQRKFDLYFHWYNLIHEMGHCLVAQYGLKKSDVQEEMYVNEFAVGYYRFIGENEKLEELKSYLQAVTGQIPSPVPADQTFVSFFESIWGTEQMMNVMLYGYFQLSSVLEAMKNDREFSDIISELGAVISPAEIKKCEETISAANAEKHLSTAMENLRAMGLKVPEISLELAEDPMIQCARFYNVF